jgi:hypothetical protein
MKGRTQLAGKALLLVTATAGPAFFFDLAYTLLVASDGESNYWLDRAHINRAYSSPDPELGFVRKPNIAWRSTLSNATYRTDENGFRNQAGLSHANLVFVGDSFTEAAQVPEEKTFVARTAAALHLTAANLGRGAYGPQQEAIVIRRYALQYKPRVIVWQFFDGNDLTDAEEFARWRDHPEEAKVSWMDRYKGDSLIRSWAERLLGPLHAGGWPADYHQTGGEVLHLTMRYAPLPQGNRAALHETRQAILAGCELAEDEGVRVVLLHIPTMWNVLDSSIEAAGRPEIPDYSPLLELLREIDPATIDALPALRQAAAENNRGLYLPDDEHLGLRGHEVVAGLIARELRRIGIASGVPSSHL